MTSYKSRPPRHPWGLFSRDLSSKARGPDLVVESASADARSRSVALGLPARRLSVLTEEAAHDLDLRGIGRILAMTSNDEVNALATTRFSRHFGRRETFQLAPNEERRNGALPEELLGRIVGIDGLDYATIDERARQGWRVRSSTATPSIAAMAEGGLFIPLARVFEGQLAFICRNDPVPTQGTVIGLAAPSVQKELDGVNVVGK